MTAMTNHWPQLSRPLEGGRLVVLSHGAGVQTVTLCFMAARGDIGPMPDVAVFADTGGESRRVYEYLAWMRPQLPFPVVIVRRPGAALAPLAIDVASGDRPRKGAPLPPWYVTTPAGEGMLPKHCSAEFKRDVVVREIRRMLGGGRITAKAPLVELWLGMTTDELFRVGTNRKGYIHNRHPLVELNMTRQDCIRWLQARQYPVPPKSACVFCPYRKNSQWRVLRDESPDDFAEAVRVDRAIRAGYPGHQGAAFVHRSCKPLDEANLDDSHIDQLDLPLGADCESCGL